MAITIVLQSVIASFPISIHTARIKATEAALTASKNADISLDFRTAGMIRLSKVTNKKEGRNIPTVAPIAPGIPLIW